MPALPARICRAKGETPMNCRTDKSMYAPNETVCVYVDGLPAETVSLRLILLHLVAAGAGPGEGASGRRLYSH